MRGNLATHARDRCGGALVEGCGVHKPINLDSKARNFPTRVCQCASHSPLRQGVQQGSKGPRVHSRCACLDSNPRARASLARGRPAPWLASRVRYRPEKKNILALITKYLASLILRIHQATDYGFLLLDEMRRTPGRIRSHMAVPGIEIASGQLAPCGRHLDPS